MAIKDNIKPTRSELIDLKKKIKLSQGGHKLLKMKRDGLILELFEILEKAKDIRSEVEKQFALATLKTCHRQIGRRCGGCEIHSFCP